MKLIKHFKLLCRQMVVYSFFYEDSGDVTFYFDEMGILSVNLDNINIDNTFDEDDPDTIIFIRFFAWYCKFKNEALKK